MKIEDFERAKQLEQRFNALRAERDAWLDDPSPPMFDFTHTLPEKDWEDFCFAQIDRIERALSDLTREFKSL
ncbi:hypothetical protein J7443_17505 [Tropicibacter sp. R15_0]|uniref:hypothetical protein n=1 Tax=Tropicibacter sp. R15_0 TaxID=2821101 RepID=UPI001ADD5AAF|nr:hypothetical protein [Tropicibacter sp. R15_0]MBO9467044.1 hypothetical protein [Tropicibacter sp. R15_0]